MDIREKVIGIIADISEIENASEILSKTNDLMQIEINSISFIKLIVKLEKQFEIEFEDEALDYSKFLSLDVLCDYVRKRMQE